MARLEFAGARYVRNYHLAVPHHELDIDKKKSLSASPSLDDNLIIHGDNLKALKALLPHYAGKLKCIYIDPPYNTGKEHWKYNDNVVSPKHKVWRELKEIDAEVQERHDIWLSMMTPRLKMLRELLTDDGIIFISIDDNEVDHLRILMDEIFGEKNMIGQLAVLVNPKGRGLREGIADEHEYVIAYGKTFIQKRSLTNPKSPEQIKNEYPERDTKGPFRWMDLRNTHREFTPENRKNLWFKIYVSPEDKKIHLENKKGRVEVEPYFDDGTEGVWTWSKEKILKENDSLIGHKTADGWRVKRKGHVTERKLKSMLVDSKYRTEQGSSELAEIIGKKAFPNPKPIFLLKELINSVARNNDIILDSFAGSGTTAHAVLALNKEDGGNRKFILVEQEEYADTITAERVRRVIKGVKGAKDEKLKAGLGGSFSYVTLGDEYDVAKILSGKSLPKYEDMASYVFQTATGETLDRKKIDKKKQFIGSSKFYDVYLFYEPDVEKLKSSDCALKLDFVEAFKGKGKKKRLVFGAVRYVNQETMNNYDVEFCQLPYEVYRRIEDAA